MSDGKNFSRRRRGGMRFRPSGNQQRRPAAQEARATATDATSGNEGLFDKSRQQEIERAQNVAAGLPAESAPKADSAVAQTETHSKKDYREPHLDTPAEVKEEFKPVEIQDQPKGIVDAIKMAAQKVIKRVQRLIKPVKRLHKEVIINAESLETRVAVL